MTKQNYLYSEILEMLSSKDESIKILGYGLLEVNISKLRVGIKNFRIIEGIYLNLKPYRKVLYGNSANYTSRLHPAYFSSRKINILPGERYPYINYVLAILHGRLATFIIKNKDKYDIYPKEFY